MKEGREGWKDRTEVGLGSKNSGRGGIVGKVMVKGGNGLWNSKVKRSCPLQNDGLDLVLYTFARRIQHKGD